MKTIKLSVVLSFLLIFSSAVHAALSAKSYIRDGLIGHWDGEENAGYGVQHSAAATVWKELTGLSPDLPVPDGASFSGGNGLNTMQQYGSYGAENNASVTKAANIRKAFASAKFTVEMAINKEKMADGKTYCKMLMLGNNWFWVGTTEENNRYGFNPNNDRYYGNLVKRYVSVGTTVGKRVFSCAQDGQQFTVRLNDLESSGTVDAVSDDPYAAAGDHGFAFNRGYDGGDGMTGTYHGIRIYDRALTADEAAVNKAIDRVRFFGYTAETATLPEGWRFNESEAGLSLQRWQAFDAAQTIGGSVTFDGSPDGYWYEQDGSYRTLAVVVEPADGYEFVCWGGAVHPEDRVKTESIRVTGPVSAMFRKVRTEGVLDSLVYDLRLDLATPDGEATAEGLYNGVRNSTASGRQTVSAVAAAYAGVDSEHIPARPTVEEIASPALALSGAASMRAVHFPQSSFLNETDSALKVCRGGVRLADEAVRGEFSVHVRFRWDGPVSSDVNAVVPLFLNGWDVSGDRGVGIRLYYGNTEKNLVYPVLDFGTKSIVHSGGTVDGEKRNGVKLAAGVWHDMVVTFRCLGDGRSQYSLYVGYLNSSNQPQLFEFTGTVLNDCLSAESPLPYMTLATAVRSGGDSDWNTVPSPGNTYLDAFRGAVSKLRVWSRVLSKEEALASFADAEGMKWSLGIPNGNAEEFAAEGSLEVEDVFDCDTMPWRRFRGRLTAANPVVTLKGRLSTVNCDEERYVKYLLIDPVADSLPASAEVEIFVNGRKAVRADLAKPQQRLVPIRRRFMTPDEDGDVTVAVKRVGESAGAVVFDRLAFFGGVQLGSNGETDFTAVQSQINQFTLGDPNVAHIKPSLLGGREDAQTIAFCLPEGFTGLRPITLESEVFGQSAQNPFKVLLNGTAVFTAAEGVVKKNVFSVSLPVELLRSGINTVRFVSEASASGSWMTLDYYRLVYGEPESMFGMSVIVR